MNPDKIVRLEQGRFYKAGEFIGQYVGYAAGPGQTVKSFWFHNRGELVEFATIPDGIRLATEAELDY